MERVRALDFSHATNTDTQLILQMRQFYEDLDTLEAGLAEVAGMQTKTV